MRLTTSQVEKWKVEKDNNTCSCSPWLVPALSHTHFDVLKIQVFNLSYCYYWAFTQNDPIILAKNWGKIFTVTLVNYSLWNESIEATGMTISCNMCSLKGFNSVDMNTSRKYQGFMVTNKHFCLKKVLELYSLLSAVLMPLLHSPSESATRWVIINL